MKKSMFVGMLLIALSGCGQCRLGQKFRHQQAPVAMQCVPMQCTPVVAPATQACPEPQLSPTFP